RNREDVVERLRNKFTIRPALFYKARARGYGKRGRWVDAAKLSLDREVARYCSVHEVLEMCISSGNDAQALLIANELLASSDPQKARTYLHLRLWREALQAAIVSHSEDVLAELSIKSRD